MNRWIFFSLMVMVLFLGIWLWQKSHRPLSGSIKITRMACDGRDNEDKPVFRLIAQNLTNKNLSPLRVKLSLGKAETLSTHTIDFERIERGQDFDLEQSFDFLDDVKVCFAKFYLGEAQIPAIFRP